MKLWFPLSILVIAASVVPSSPAFAETRAPSPSTHAGAPEARRDAREERKDERKDREDRKDRGEARKDKGDEARERSSREPRRGGDRPGDQRDGARRGERPELRAERREAEGPARGNRGRITDEKTERGVHERRMAHLRQELRVAESKRDAALVASTKARITHEEARHARVLERLREKGGAR